MGSDMAWQPSVRMKDRWYEHPIGAAAFLAGMLTVFWWGREAEPARFGQVAFPTVLFFMWWAGRDRQLAARIAVLSDAVQGLQAVIQAGLQSAASDAGTGGPPAHAKEMPPTV